MRATPTKHSTYLNEGYQRYKTHRALRAFRVVALHRAGQSDEAIYDVMDLMLEALHPAKFDGYAAKLRETVDEIRPDHIPPPPPDIEEI